MRHELVTYDLFCQVVQKMQEQHEKLSVRAILNHTGGSFAKIADFLKRWRQEQAHAQSSTGHELSTHLRQALRAEIGKAVAETKALLEDQLNRANDQLDEAHDALAQQEQSLADYEQRITQTNQQLAIAHQIQTQQVERIASLEYKLEQSLLAQHEADKRAAIAETRSTEWEKQLARYEKESVPKQ